MTEQPVPPVEDELGSIDYLVMEFPHHHVTDEGFEMLLDLVERGVIRILDVEFVVRNEDDLAVRVPVAQLSTTDGADLGVWDGACSDLLDSQDIAEIGEAIAPDSVALVVIFENRWILGLADAWRHAGARLVADGASTPRRSWPPSTRPKPTEERGDHYGIAQDGSQSGRGLSRARTRAATPAAALGASGPACGAGGGGSAPCRAAGSGSARGSDGERHCAAARDARQAR